MALSIRWRLTLWNMLALALGLIGLGILVYGLLQHALYQRIDQGMSDELQEMQDKPTINVAYWIKELKEHENYLCVVYGPSGDVYERTEEMPAESLDALAAPSWGERSFSDRTLPILGHQRILSAPV